MISKGSSKFSGLGKVHGKVPSIKSSGCTPACNAAERIKNLMLEPVCRRRNAMLTSLCPALKPGPPTIARIAPVLESSEISDAVMPALFSGSFSLTACSAAACASKFSVV